MNPPPIPPEYQEKPSASSQLALASLIAPALAIGLRIAVSSALQGNASQSQSTMVIVDLVAGLLIFAGLIAGIIALSGIPSHGSKGILGRGVTGLIINSLLILIFITNFFYAYGKKAAARRDALANVESSAANYRSNINHSFDSKKGITNVDLGQLDRFRSDIKNASTNLSGDDASIAGAMDGFLGRMSVALKNYQASLNALGAAHVMKDFSSMDKEQFASRREVVQRFLKANDGVKQVVTNAEDSIRADLVKAQVSESHVEAVITGYRSTALPLNRLTLQIRQCDDTMGNSMLDALNTLEDQPMNWKFDTAKGQLLFTDENTRERYNKSIRAMNAAGQEQIALQAKLIAVQREQAQARAQSQSQFHAQN